MISHMYAVDGWFYQNTFYITGIHSEKEIVLTAHTLILGWGTTLDFILFFILANQIWNRHWSNNDKLVQRSDRYLPRSNIWPEDVGEK